METKAVKKTAAPKAAASKTEAPKAAAPKKAPAKGTSKTVVLVQTGSQTCISPSMKATLKGLGLGKPRSRRELLDTPETRGMLWKVRHLVKVEGE